jgi:methionine-rich copper-binding protein CopC
VKAKPDTWRLAAFFGLSAAWLLLSCGPALAHARLVETYPADGGTLVEPPEQVQLLFNEPVEAEFNPIEVYDQGGERVDEDDARVSPNDARLLVVDLEELSEGSYTVEWRVTSADAHPISGTYGFAVDASAADADAGAGESIELIERSAEQEETGSTWGLIPAVVLGGVLLVGALAVAGFVTLRRRKGTG